MGWIGKKPASPEMDLDQKGNDYTTVASGEPNSKIVLIVFIQEHNALGKNHIKHR